MLELPHVLVGAAIATIVPNPLLAVPISLTSHFLGDYVPHWNPSPTRLLKYPLLSTWVILILDSFLAITVAMTLTLVNLSTPLLALNIFLCSLAASFPDLVEIPIFVFGHKNRLLMRLAKFQKRHQFNVSVIPGLISQLLVVLFCLAVILR